MNDNHEPTHLDLFSGLGGSSLAAQWAGFRTVAFCEINPYCQEILKARFGAAADADGDRYTDGGTKKRQQHGGRGKTWRESSSSGQPRLFGDIRTLDGAKYAGIDLLTGGFPCQPFSVAGKRGGAADDRFLWPEMLRVVSEARPAWVLGENVAGIIGMELDRVLSDLENIGYAVWPLVIPAVAVDAKHRRDRVWIVAHASSQSANRHSIRTMSAYTMPGNGGSLTEAISTGLEIEQRQPENDGWQQPATQRDGDWWCRWQPEPDVGRVVNELPVGMDGSPCVFQPEPKEVPRVAKGIKNRVERLKSLGNAIIPSVAFQILKEIRRLI